MKFTFNRPTKPGRYWLSLDPEQRQNLPSVFCVLVDRSERGRWSVTSSEREAGFCNVNLEDDLFNGAQWAPRETPADPFAEPAQPTMNCPRCKKEYEDFDGVGVVFCDPKTGGCGFCRHVARSGGVCEMCRDKESALPPWRVELERLRGMVRERQCLAGEELQRLTKLEELDALRSLKEGGQPIAIPDWVLQVEPGFTHFTPGTFRLLDGAWRERTGICVQSIKAQELDELIDGAGAAVMAGE